MNMDIDLTSLNLSQLQDLAERIDNEIETREKSRLQKIQQEVNLPPGFQIKSMERSVIYDGGCCRGKEQYTDIICIR